MKYLLMTTLYCLCAVALAADYTGNQMVAVLGKPIYSPEFQQYKSFWLLNNKFENPDGGIKVIINPNTLTVDTILVIGYDYAPSYSNCSSKLPYNIQLNDNISAISQKTGAAPMHYDDNVGYDVQDYQIMVKYNNSSNINCVRFFAPQGNVYAAVMPKASYTTSVSKPASVASTNTLPENATRMDVARNNFENATYISMEAKAQPVIAKPVASTTEPVKTSTAPAVNDKLESARRALENSTFNHNTPVKVSAPAPSTTVVKTSTPAASSTTPKPSTAATNTSKSTSTTTVAKSYTFKSGILEVFNSFRESGFYNIKHAQRSSGNVWNYKYTYSTKLRIPGEQYNMLYCFPFENSQLDFVSVLKESDSFDGFEAAYKQFEAKLMAEFPKSEGWVGTCLPNYDKSKISDFEMRNDRYGSVILDYCKTPKGKHILYLRFLLYS
ncbi:MAG: hypothetical protein JST49_02485 [Bacteroidetes bacterium]|nr:hypothetical protein [Bacteroidota bacterium]